MIHKIITAASLLVAAAALWVAVNASSVQPLVIAIEQHAMTEPEATAAIEALIPDNSNGAITPRRLRAAIYAAMAAKK